MGIRLKESFPQPGLRSLLHRSDFERLVEVCWNQRHAHITDLVEDVRSLYDRNCLHRLLSETPVTVKAAKLEGGRHFEYPVRGPAAMDELAAGATLCFHAIHRYEPSLSNILAQSKLDLGLVGQSLISAYLSDHDRGFGLHFDEHHVFLLQVEGAKRWSISSTPVIRDPPCNAIASLAAEYNTRYPWAQLDPPDEASLDEVLLREGEMLYLPPGTWHRGRAEGTSFGLTMSFRSAGFEDFVRAMLTEELERDPEWRSGPPIDAGAEDSWKLPPPVETWATGQLGIFRAFANRLTLEQFHRWWLKELARLPGDPPNPGPVAREPWSRATRPPGLRLRCSLDPDDEATGLLIVGGRQLARLPVHLEPFIQEVARHGVLTRDDLHRVGHEHGLDADDADALARIFARCGFWEMQA